MKKLLPVLLFFISVHIYTQKEANIWYFGRNAGIDFNTSPPTAITDGQLSTFEGCSTFSDSNGNLLFYVGAPNTNTSWLTVWSKEKDTNGNHKIMTYTDGNLANDLLGDTSSTQSAMIIPKPGSNSIYYIFTVGDQNNPNFSLYTIDMSLNNGYGQLIDENNDGVFFDNLAANTGEQVSWTEKVAAVRGDACNEFWSVSLSGSNFYSYKIDQNGVNLNPVVSPVNKFSNNTRGYLKLSPNGKKLVVAHENSNEAILYSFDSTTGRVPNDGISLFNIGVNDDGRAYGVEFSIDSKKLYISSSSRFRLNLDDPIPSTYKLFQYDLESSDIVASKQLIFQTNNGFRGSLQLGPDGKIYTTIPQAYDDVTGDASFLSVIENPTEDATNIVFTLNSISLEGKKATQGLPPFLSSLLLPIELTDTETNQVINNQIIQYCLMDNVIIQPEEVTAQSGTTIDYEWNFNGNLLSDSINLTLNNLDFGNQGDYILKVTLTDECGNPTLLEGVFTLEVYNNITIEEPLDINHCDDDRDGFNTYNFETLVSPTVWGNQDQTGKEIVYYTLESDALANTNPIPNPSNYTNQNSFVNEIIWVRIHNLSAPNACNEIRDFELNIFDLPSAEQPQDIMVCDGDDTDSNDNDGIYDNFLLNSRDSEILGNLDHNQYNVSYHTSLADAQTSATTNAIDKNSNYQSGNDTIFVRVENINNVNCNDTSQSFKLIVHPLPTPVDVTLLQCDDDADLNSNVNLTLEQPNISANHANETFEYFETLAHAEAGTPTIADPVNYNVNNGDTVHVRTITAQGCFRITKIDIVISFAADVPYNDTFIQCDDFLDANGNNTPGANNDTDGIATFNFSSAETDILAFFPPLIRNDLEVKFFETIADRASEINEIPDTSNHRNNNNPSYAHQQTIYAKIINTVNNDCTGLAEFILQVTPVPTANSINATNELEECDDLIDGDATNGVAQFDLEELTPIILGNQSTMAYTVTYHHSSNDAATGDNPIDTITPYRNHTSPFRQTIFVRVQGNGCYFDRYTFDLVVNPTPTANAINTTNTLEVCDNDDDGSATNGFVQDLDLEMLTEVILGNNQNNNDFTLTYHTTFALAQSGNTPITGPYTNDSNPDRIFVRIVNNNTQCVNTNYNFDIQVNPEPLDNPDGLVSNLSECDNTTDGDDTNGFIQTFDLESQIPDILGDPNLQDEDDFEVTFHLTQADATAGDNPQSTPFTNTLRNRQTIFVRIENKATGCVNDDLTFDAIVNPLPDFQVTTPQTVCLNNTPLTLRVENPNTIYTYQWQDDNGNSLGTDISQEVATGGQYTVTATTTDGTLCQRSKTITVKESNIATITDDDITIVDDSQNNSITINNNTNNLGEGDYEFALQSENGILVRDYQDHNVFEGLEGGIYTIFVRDKNGCGVVTFTVPIVEFPKFFTPNGDGIKDTWKIKGATLRFFPESSIQIFNRQGKVIASMRIDSPGWNGTYLNNTPLPSNDYWYRIQLIDTQGNIRHRKGHFSLIRR